ncbi:MAG: S8 family serine peptidase [Acidobacteria bacterium]|nr:S8 family serine peptidase [Acidobacteriota bacterium]
MSFGKFLLTLLAAGVLSAQVVPDWYVLELSEVPSSRARGVRRIRDSQQNVRTAIASRFGARAQVRDFTEVVMNALIVEAKAGEAELSAIPGVKRVWPVYEVHPELDRAVGLLQISKVWESVGGSEKAGAGTKIGILDSGLDLKHPAFQSNTLAAPDGFPKASNDEIRGQLNGKVIVYRSYERMAGFEESSADNSGHGTAVAMAAAGMRVKSPLAEIQGAAPAAWLGVYKVFGGPNGASSTTAIVTKAIDDAAADGMDALNFSFGFLPQARAAYDPLLPAIERAGSLGISFFKSNGNSGPLRLSGSTPSLGNAGLTVGASWTDRIFASGIRVNGGDPLVAIAGDGPAPAGPVTAPFKDIASIDPTALACQSLPAGSLSGTVALILRGDCTFETKLKAAEAAGAVAAVVYTHAASPNVSVMAVGTAALPAVMIGNRDGLRVKSVLGANPDSTVFVAFDNTVPFLIDADGISSFSSRGPGPDGGIRPDLLAIGEEILTAAQSSNKNGEVYSASGFAVVDGTSFSSPLVAGGYAVLKAGRPGLTPAQYRSLLVNTAQQIPASEVRSAPVQVGGAGRLDLQAALRGRLTMEPVSISFGLGGQRVDMSKTLRIQSVTAGVGTWRVEVDSGDDVKPIVEPSEFSLGAADTVDLRVKFSGDLQLGEYQGFLLLRRLDAEEGERPQRVAYWYGVPTGKPAAATFVPGAPSSAAAGSTVSLPLLVTDAIGAGTPLETPKVTVLEGSGDFVDATSAEEAFPGYWLIRLRMGSVTGQANRFRIEVGSIIREVSINAR